MPTSSQSQILSVVDYQLIQQQQQQASGQDGTIKPLVHISIHQTPRRLSKDNHRKKEDDDDDDNQSPPPPNLTNRRRSSGNGATTSRTLQRTDLLHMPVVDINSMAHNDEPRRSNQNHRNSLNDESQIEYEYKLKQLQKHPSSVDNHNSSASDFENMHDDDEHPNVERRSSLLNESARRLLILGTIRPSRSFYRDLPAADAEYLMEYFRRMRITNRKVTSEEINQELKTKFTEYKPKIFFDSASVTKSQVNQIEKMIERYADQIRAHKAELIKLDNPIRFVIKQLDNDTPLTTIPREYNDCFLTLVTRTDPLHKSQLVTELVQDKLLDDVKNNSLDISYFPGGINYDVPHEEINEDGQMKLETYDKLKQRLGNRKVRYFSEPPEKKPNALLAIIPLDSSINIDHQRLIDCLHDHLKALSTNENFDITKRILSIEFLPLNCILNSNDISNQFIIDCDSKETKQQLLDKPLKMISKKHSITIELHSYDDTMQKEYDKFIKSEKYRELLKNHDDAVKRK